MTGPVRKSLFVIAGLGLGGCLALGFMMRQVLEVRDELQRSPFALVLEQEFGSRLVEPAVVREERSDGHLRLHARLVVFAGLRKSPIVELAGERLWMQARASGVAPVEVTVQVLDDDRGEDLQRSVPDRMQTRGVTKPAHSKVVAPPRPPR